MENTNQKGETLQTTDSVGVTETQDVLNRIVKVNNYNIVDMKIRNWKFFVGGRKVNKKEAQEALDLGMHCITAKWRKN